MGLWLIELQGPDFSGRGVIKKVLLQGPEDFSGLKEWKRSPSRDWKAFPAWINVKILWMAGKKFLH